MPCPANVRRFLTRKFARPHPGFFRRPTPTTPSPPEKRTTLATGGASGVIRKNASVRPARVGGAGTSSWNAAHGDASARSARSRSVPRSRTLARLPRPRRAAAPRHEAVREVRRARLARPPRRRPVAAAAGRLDEEHVPRPHDDADLLRLEEARRPPAREQPGPVREAVPAAEETARRLADAPAPPDRDRSGPRVHAAPEDARRAPAGATRS